jgi:hypothetical protein
VGSASSSVFCFREGRSARSSFHGGEERKEGRKEGRLAERKHKETIIKEMLESLRDQLGDC